ncbi:hypothetical protein ABIB94_008353 [Bradyrhizobium sp. JR7.2]|uniref:hypothetical protein n=1 Tax=unclassified Bradyrhizobium TaxID=2631580 RepID=UPI003397606F
MIKTPIGFVPLLEAVNEVETRLGQRDLAIQTIAGACESGKLKAGYRSVTGGADDLDPKIWQNPQWRLFERGEIELVLPLLDDNDRPNTNGFTSRCEREVFVRRQGLDDLLETIVVPRSGAAAKGGRPLKLSRIAVAAEVTRLMDHHGEFSPDDPEWNAQARLREALIRKFGEAAPSTVDEYIKEPLAAWRKSHPKT